MKNYPKGTALLDEETKKREGINIQNAIASNRRGNPSDTSRQNAAQGYTAFNVSNSTAAADRKRQEMVAQKPGDFTYAPYQKSDVVMRAEALLQQQLGNKPGTYQSRWQAQLDDILGRIMNREEFSYDLNGDARYQQYKDQYTNQGRMAMMDAIGQAQSMTGGHGNSYAQTVGQQTYQGYLQQLNNVIPELYQLALDQHNREGDALYDQYAMYADRENQDYGRYRDQMSDYYTELDRLTEDARYKAETDYGQHWDERNYQYQLDRDRVSDERWQAEFDEAVRQYNHANGIAVGENTGNEVAVDSGNDDAGNPGDYYGYPGNQGYDEETVKKAQSAVGADDDGMWGPDSAAKAEAMGYKSIVDVVNAINDGTLGQPVWNDGIDTTRNNDGLKGSAWDYTRANLAQLIRSGSEEKAMAYMEQVVDSLNETQFQQLYAMLRDAKYVS